MLSMLYARPPKADVSRAFLDVEDDQARVAGIILQRILNRGFEEDVSRWDDSVRQGIEDWLIVGMGQIWLRYEVEIEQEEMPATLDEFGNELVGAYTQERIVEEDAPVDYIHWQDFYWSPARTWNEVRWVARRVYMTKDQLTARFGKEISDSVPIQSVKATDQNNLPQHDVWNKAQVFEIWCKEHKKVYWFAQGALTILDVKDDPLDLEGFFPCPRPLMANVTSSNLMPRADYIFAQDQFNELDEINTRITWLTRAAKVVGVYDRAADGIQRMFNQGSENQLIPVDNWAMFAEGGGIKGKVDWAPIDQVVNAINNLRVYRQDKVQQIYEILGVSDVMRGSSKASETATAQQLKAQFGSTRVQLMQFYIAQWISEALRIKAEIICKHWQPQTMVARSNIDRTVDAQIAPQALQLLKDEHVAQYRINVEADSMAALDWAAERDAAVQFMQGLGAFISQVSPLAQGTPEAAPFLMRLLQWGVSKFRVSTEIEGVLDQAIASMQQSLTQPKQPPQPTPDEVMRAQIEGEKIKSNERIAVLQAQKDEEIASLKATVELQKIELKSKLDQVQSQFESIRDVMHLNPDSGQKVGELLNNVGSIAQNALDTQLMTQAQMAQLMEVVSKKKKRVPIRDPKTGDILEVREIDDEPAVSGMADLPSAIPNMPPLNGAMGGVNG
jgi:hypothetical protein